MSKTNPARGMRDFLPADVRKREYVIGVIKSVYESYGFEPLETPAVENIDTLMGKYGDEGNQLIFKILKRGEKLRESMESRVSGESRESDDSQDSRLADLALRYDLTVPLARVVANHKNDLPKFFKRYQIQPVWRADRPARGRFREFFQCDVDCIGSESMVVEAEIISAACDILTRLGFEDFVLRLNHRDVLTAMLEIEGIPVSKHQDALIAIDKLDKIQRAGVEKEFENREIDLDAGKRLIDKWDLLSKVFDNVRALDTLEDIVKDVPKGKIAASLLKDIFLFLDPKLRGTVRIDSSLARGLSYYTGTIMEINVDGIGSLGGGGRYDGLIGMFGKEQIPACGFSLGLERILVVMEERGMFPPEIADSSPADVMVTIWSDETIADSLKLAHELRAAGLRVTVYPEVDKLGKQLKYADSIRVPYVCVLGESELADGTVTLKNMKTGEQQAYSRSEIASKIV